MNASTEIRKLSPSHVRELVHILEDANSWKKLMEIIPKRLEKDNYECSFGEDNPQKYHSEHFRLIERASRSYQRPCSEILLDEWGTSGRVRPSLGHLLNLLKQAELYRAADFVAIDLLKSTKPQRPKEGPAAHVHVTFLLEDRRGEVEEVLEDVRCDSSDIRNLNNTRNSSSNTIDNNIEVNLPAQRKVVQLVNPIHREVSDMMKFSQSIEDNADIPQTQSDVVPNISSLLHSQTPDIPQNEVESCIVPQISALLTSKTDEDNMPRISKLLLISALLSTKSNSDVLPQISELLTSKDESDTLLPQISTLLTSKISSHEDDLVPQISALLSSHSTPQNPLLTSKTSDDFVPQISALLSSHSTPQNRSEFLPQLSTLLGANEETLSSLLPQRIRELLLSKRIDQYTLVPELSAGGIGPEISEFLDSLPDDQINVLLSSLLPQDEGNGEGPQISKLLHSEHYSGPQISELLKTQGDDAPMISKLLQSSNPKIQLPSGDFVPQISDFLDVRNNPHVGSRSQSADPEIKIDFLDVSNNPPQISISLDTHQSLLSPNVNPSTSNELPTLTSSPNSNSSSSGRPQCNSPLPNLSLNTILPHFNYQELELATSNFDETPHPKGRFLGSGAFGSVFLCLGLLEKPTAVKKLHLDGATEVNVNDTITKQFRNEVELLCSYKHDNLLSICGYSCDGPTYCIMYEYISGGALNYRLENHKEDLNWRDRMRIACGTAEAVAYLHTAYSRQLIHRDIKTANILLDSANKPKLGDFGIIKLSPNKNTTVTTTIIGTSVYMAPECFRSGEVTEKTDTFSFGVVILELLTALPPLDENREARDLITHVEDMCDNNSIAPLLDLSAGSWTKGETNVAEELFKVANRCLGEKKHRPNMVEVADVLNKLIAN